MNNNLGKRSEKYDFILIIITLCCVIFGVFAIKSAVKAYEGGSSSFVLIQSFASVAGLILMAIVGKIDYNKYKKLSKLIYVLCTLFLIAVLIIGTGREDTGSKSWIRFGPIGIQPSEIVKIGFIITFSKAVSGFGDELNRPKNIFKLILHASVFIY